MESDTADRPGNLITTAQLRDILPVHRVTVHRMIKDPDSGFPRPVKIARRLFFYEAEIRAWIASHRDQAA